MNYKIESFSDLNSIDITEKYGELKEISYNDDDVMCDNDSPAFSFALDFKDKENWCGFQIDLKQAIYLRNALNSFIEINRSFRE